MKKRIIAVMQAWPVVGLIKKVAAADGRQIRMRFQSLRPTRLGGDTQSHKGKGNGPVSLVYTATIVPKMLNGISDASMYKKDSSKKPAGPPT